MSRGVTTLIRAYDRVQNVLSFLDLVTTVANALNTVASMPPEEILQKALPKPGLPKIDFAEAAEAFARNLRRAAIEGGPNWGTGFMRSQELGSRLTAVLIYLPITMPALGLEKNLKTGLKVHFRKQQVPVELVLGAKKKNANFQLAGLGVKMGINRQLFRMDFNPLDPTHGGAAGKKANEIDVWKDGAFHFHLNTWNQ